MEGVPKLPMLSVEGKPCGGHTEFAPLLMQYILRKYQEDPSKYEAAIEKLMDLRETVTNRMMGDVGGCKAMKEYYAQLHLLKSRFPMEAGDSVALPFSWYEKFSDISSPTIYEDVNYELACVLHNIGAVHSLVGTAEARSSPESMKAACTHFQHALFAFTQLQEMRGAKEFSPDFDDSILNFYCVLMQAQAQECILEKSIVDHRKDVIVAKVANQVSDFYEKCSVLLDQGIIADIAGSSKSKGWKKFVLMKGKVYSAIANLYMGQNASEQGKFGERLGWYQVAETALAEATKLAHKETEGVHESLQFTRDVIVGKMENAKKENDFIYHEKVPSPESLPPIAKVVLVKGIPFDPLDPNVSGPDLFESLIPGRVHVSNSVYSEEKAKLLRQIDERVAEKEESLREYLASLDLESLNLGGGGEVLDLPDGLLERSSAFNAQPEAVPNLISSLQRLTGCYQETESKLADFDQRLASIQTWLKEASREGLKFPSIREFIPKGTDLHSEYKESLDQYKRAHAQATLSNTELQKAVAYHSENLKLLGLPLSNLKTLLPAPAKQESPEREEMLRLSSKVEEMRSQRASLLASLRADVHADDLTRRLLADKDADAKVLFEKELEKFSKRIEIIDQNLSAQDNILRAMTRANALYADARKQANSARRERDTQIQGLIASYDAYQEVLSKAERGRLFYEKLLSTLNEFEDDLEKLEDTLTFKRKELDTAKTRTPSVNPGPTSDHGAYSSAPRPSQAGSGPSGGDRERKGPRLGDYMAYYRAKQAGTAPVPPPSVSADPATSTNPPSSSVAPPPQPPSYQYPPAPSFPSPNQQTPGNHPGQSFHANSGSTPSNTQPTNIPTQTNIPTTLSTNQYPLPESGQQPYHQSYHAPRPQPFPSTTEPPRQNFSGGTNFSPSPNYQAPMIGAQQQHSPAAPASSAPSPGPPSSYPQNFQHNIPATSTRPAPPHHYGNFPQGPSQPSSQPHMAGLTSNQQMISSTGTVYSSANSSIPSAAQFNPSMGYAPRAAYSSASAGVAPQTSMSFARAPTPSGATSGYSAVSSASVPGATYYNQTPSMHSSIHNNQLHQPQTTLTNGRSHMNQSGAARLQTPMAGPQPQIGPANPHQPPGPQGTNMNTSSLHYPPSSYGNSGYQGGQIPASPNPQQQQQQNFDSPKPLQYQAHSSYNSNVTPQGPGIICQTAAQMPMTNNNPGPSRGDLYAQPRAQNPPNSVNQYQPAQASFPRPMNPSVSTNLSPASYQNGGHNGMSLPQNPVGSTFSQQPGMPLGVMPQQTQPQYRPQGQIPPQPQYQHVSSSQPQTNFQVPRSPAPPAMMSRAPVRFEGMDAPIQDPSLPLPLQPSKLDEPPAPHELTPTEKALAEVFTPVVETSKPDPQPSTAQPIKENIPVPVEISPAAPAPAPTTVSNDAPSILDPRIGKTVPDVIPDGDKGSMERANSPDSAPIPSSLEQPVAPHPVEQQNTAENKKLGLTELLDPNKFQLGQSKGHRKTKKEEFFKEGSTEKKVEGNADDPFAFLDPFPTKR